MTFSLRAFDTDGDGKVSKEEFQLCMLNFGERFGEDEIEEIPMMTVQLTLLSLFS